MAEKKAGPKGLSEGLERLYRLYNRRQYVSPDPLQVLYDYDDPADREIAGIIASGLAFGRVAQILSAIDRVLGPMGTSPRAFILSTPSRELKGLYAGFQYRFVKGPEMGAFLSGLKKALQRWDSLEAMFAAHLPTDLQEGGPAREPKTLIRAVSGGIRELLSLSGLRSSYLLASPEKGSACKRLFLFLRWMIRRDEVDPGGWEMALPSSLVIPLDTHMHHIARDLGLTRRRQADLKTALEVTSGFSSLCPEDPVRYDFVLTRFGIREELERGQVPELVFAGR